MSQKSTDSDISSRQTTMYHALELLIEESFREGEEEQKDIQEYDIWEYRLRIAMETVKTHKNEIKIGFLYAFFMLQTVGSVISYLQFIYVLDASLLSQNLLWYVLMIIGPFATWIWSTSYDYYNFWRRKNAFLIFSIINAFLKIMELMTLVFSSVVFYLFSIIPRTEDISISMVCTIVRIVLLLVTLLPLVLIARIVLREMFSSITQQAIRKFKIKKYLSQMKKEGEFEYSMTIVRNLETGAKHVIHEKDRFLHSLSNGVTGTGKTSSCFIPAIYKDMEQIVYNKEFQKNTCERWLNEGKIRLKRPITDREFTIDAFSGVDSDSQRELNKLKMKAKVAGITAIAPDAAFSDEVYELARLHNLSVNRIDPVFGKDGKLKPGFKGFNPLYITPGLNQIEFLIEAARRAIMWADVAQAIFDSEGSSDVYFASLNEQVNSTVAMLLLFTYPALHNGEQPVATDIQAVLNNFQNAQEYLYTLQELYARRDDTGRFIVNQGKPVFVQPIFQMIYDVVSYELLGPGADKMNDQCRGLRNIINSLLSNINVAHVLCSRNSVDIEKALEEGQITVLNFALELGTSGKALGLFYMLSLISAVYRRPGNEDTRIPNFCYIDELPQLLHPSLEQCFVLFRKYRVAMFVAIQSLSQMEKAASTAFLKPVLLGNCAHHFVFGRAGTEEMEFYEKLAGVYEKQQNIEQVNQTSIIADNPSISYGSRIQSSMENNIEGGQIHERDFQEVTVVTVDEGSPVAMFFGKLSFLPRYKKKFKLKEYSVDWIQYYNSISYKQEFTPVEKDGENMNDVLRDVVKKTSSDQFDMPVERKKQEMPAFLKTMRELGKEDEEGTKDVDDVSSNDETSTKIVEDESDKDAGRPMIGSFNFKI